MNEGSQRGGREGENHSSHLTVPVVPLSVCRGLVVLPVVEVVAATSWVIVFPPSLLAVLSVVSPVVAPPLWLVVLESPVASSGEAVLVPV